MQQATTIASLCCVVWVVQAEEHSPLFFQWGIVADMTVSYRAGISAGDASGGLLRTRIKGGNIWPLWVGLHGEDSVAEYRPRVARWCSLRLP